MTEMESVVHAPSSTISPKMAFSELSKSDLQISTKAKFIEESCDNSTVHGDSDSPGVLSCRSVETELYSGDHVFQNEIDCPAHLVGRVIGERGLLVKKLQSQTRCAISVAPSGPEPSIRKITLRGGTTEAVEGAYKYIDAIISSDASRFSVLEDQKVISSHMKCPSNSVGRIIGRNGSNIKSLQLVHNVNIMIDQSGTKQGNPAIVTISGRVPDVKKAEKDVIDFIEGNHKENNIGGRTVSCPVNNVQLLLDKSNGALERLEKKSNAKIEIEMCLPQMNTCLFHVSGLKNEVDAAIDMILNYMRNYYPTLVSPRVPIVKPYPNIYMVNGPPVMSGPVCQQPIPLPQVAMPPVNHVIPHPVYFIPYPPNMPPQPLLPQRQYIPTSMQFISHGEYFPQSNFIPSHYFPQQNPEVTQEISAPPSDVSDITMKMEHVNLIAPHN